MKELSVAASDAHDYDGRWRVFAVIVVGAFMAQLDLFIVDIAFPAIARSFPGVSASTLSWVLDAYAHSVPSSRAGEWCPRSATRISEADPTWEEWSC
jgi:hypothetical protein